MSSIHDNPEHFENPDGQYGHWGTEAAGCIFIAKDTGRILLAHRSDQVDYEPHTWGTWGGKIDSGETPAMAVNREVEEETGFDGMYKIHPLYVYRDGGFEYHNYMVLVPFEFKPQLNWENDNSKWVEYGQWPKPLHYGMEALIQHAGDKIQRVIRLLKAKKPKLTESTETPIRVVPQGLMNIGVKGYKWVTPYGYLSYGHDEANNVFDIYMIQTKSEFQNQGHGRNLLDKFFMHVKSNRGRVHVDSYTLSGLAWIKHVIERLANKYGVRLI